MEDSEDKIKVRSVILFGLCLFIVIPIGIEFGDEIVTLISETPSRVFIRLLSQFT